VHFSYQTHWCRTCQRRWIKFKICWSLFNAFRFH